jgi:hypothetical protein
MNDRGQPVIHDIASKLGCIRPSPDLPYAFPEGADDFAELQAQLQAARSEMGSEDTGCRKNSDDSTFSSPALAHTDRASSSDSDSDHSIDSNQQSWTPRQRISKANPPAINTSFRPTPSKLHGTSLVDDESQYSARSSYDASGSLPSPIYTDFATESPMFRTTSPFSPWGVGDDFMGPAHALDLTAHYSRQQQFQLPRSSPLSGRPLAMDSEMMKMQMNDGMNFANGTIRPNMLDCNTGYDMNDIIYTDGFENTMAMV